MSILEIYGHIDRDRGDKAIRMKINKIGEKSMFYLGYCWCIW